MSVAFETTENIAEHASLLMWRLREDDRWEAWYNPDRWGGRVGLANYLATVAAALEAQLAPRDWSEVDRYHTIDEVAHAILLDELDTHDMSSYYVEIGPVEPSVSDSGLEDS